MKKMKHRIVEHMSSSTADALGLSRAILCNGEFEDLHCKNFHLSKTAKVANVFWISRNLWILNRIMSINNVANCNLVHSI